MRKTIDRVASEIPNDLFIALARAVVPDMRRSVEDAGLSTDFISPSVAMTGTLMINGREERVKISVTLAPSEEGQ